MIKVKRSEIFNNNIIISTDYYSICINESEIKNLINKLKNI
jgi:hypothetical protein